MDTVILTDQTALRAIRAERRRRGLLVWEHLSPAASARVLAAATANEGAIDREELVRLGALGLENDEAHLLVGSASRRRGGSGIRCHLASRPRPWLTLLKIRPGLFCCAPLAVTVQFSRSHGIGETAALMMELMGTYSLDAEVTAGLWDPSASLGAPRESGLSHLRLSYEPVLDAGQLRRASGHMRDGSGTRVFAGAASFALPDAASPMETIMVAMLAAPKSAGGFGCKNLSRAGIKVNWRIELTPEARAIAKMPYVICDAYIPAALSCFEYNGGYHTDERARMHDENRNAGLAAMGIETIVINRQQIKDVQALECIAKRVYLRAGKRYRQTVTGHRQLQNDLLHGLRVGSGLPPQ
ncbi:MAG: hypothetical protein E7001_01335 [Coriobacteriaceae bacterium]|nr:hypothetical protein [Coriobacteriaceae bacterium]